MNGLTRWNQLFFSSLVAGFLILSGICAYLIFQEKQVKVVKIAAGSKSGEAYDFAMAISEIVSEHHENIYIKVIETKGSEENMDYLGSREVDLAMTQADIKASPSARIIATLYSDLFQLVARKDANISSFKDIRGKQIALPSQGGGQWVSFWFVAKHYGIEESDFVYKSLSTDSAVAAVIDGRLDGLFRVRAAPHDPIAEIVTNCEAEIVPIYQGAAMRLKQPSLANSFIPLGAYRGDPAIPEVDVPTVSVDRLLIASKYTDPYVVKVITQILFERRRELLQLTPLAGFIVQPNRESGTFIPIHKGATAYYDRDKPHFLVENADFFALILSFILMLFSAAFGLRSLILNNQKNKADIFTKQLISITEKAKSAQDIKRIRKLRNELLEILATVVDALDNDKISPEGFNFFSFTWNVSFTVLKDREEELLNNEEQIKRNARTH